MITPLKTRCRDLVERLRDIKAIRAKGIGHGAKVLARRAKHRVEKIECGIRNAEMIEVGMRNAEVGSEGSGNS
jgi:hypothetical protein